MDGCVVEVRDPVPDYLTISYVWGAVCNFRLTRANRPSLLLPGAIQQVWANLPATIRDTITLCQNLGKRYLWVDSLCLLQNDKEDDARGVEVMDRIFGRALLTIVAACGHDANAGLPGVRPGNRAEQALTREVCLGIFLGAYIAAEHLLLTSVYNTRAWTYVFLPRTICAYLLMLCSVDSKRTRYPDDHYISSKTRSSSNVNCPNLRRWWTKGL